MPQGFADVIRQLMEDQDPEAFHDPYRQWQERVLANRSGRFRAL